jgi:hypothetical protein
MSNKFRVIFVFILIFLISPTMESLQAQSRRISSDKFFGCTEKDYFGKLENYIVQKDMEAFQKGLMAGVLTGKCIIFKSGEEVFLADTAIFSGLIKLRRKGEVVEYWTNIEATK